MPEREAEAGRAYLHQFLQENNARLTGIISAYIVRMGLACGDGVHLLAADVFQDAALEMLVHAERLDPARPPHAWFLGVAANILKRRRTSLARRSRFEVLVSDLTVRGQNEDQSDVLDMLMAQQAPGPEQRLEAREQLEEMLALVSGADAKILRLTYIQDLSAEMIAQQLGVKTGAVRVRLHRAQQRLRVAWSKREEQEKRGQNNA